MEDPTVLYSVIGGFAAVQAVTLLIIAYIYYKIVKENVQTPVTMEGPNPQTLPQCEYDLKQLKSMLTKTILSTVISFFIFYKWNITKPFLLQGVMGLLGLFNEKLVQLYIFGYPAEGPLKRPFKVDKGFLQNWLEEQQAKMQAMIEEEKREAEREAKKAAEETKKEK